MKMKFQGNRYIHRKWREIKARLARRNYGYWDEPYSYKRIFKKKDREDLIIYCLFVRKFKLNMAKYGIPQGGFIKGLTHEEAMYLAKLRRD